MSDQRKRAWEMMPEEFGREFSPHRIYGENGTRFFYKAVDPSARPMSYATRDEAVRHAHRHVVAAALAAGVAVPPEVAALYPDIAAGEQLPDIAVIAVPARHVSLFSAAAREHVRHARATLERPIQASTRTCQSSPFRPPPEQPEPAARASREQSSPGVYPPP